MSKSKHNGRSSASDHLAGSTTTGSGYLTGPGLIDLPVQYAVVQGRAIYQGCIDMGPASEVAAEAEAKDQSHHLRATTVAAGADASVHGDEQMGVGLPGDSSFLWTGGRVAWTVDAAVPNQSRITDAIAHLEQNTGIRFVRRTSSNASSLPNWIRIVSNGSESWSSSQIGMRGGEQLLRLADGHPVGVLVHEFLHALGVYHEQSRSDRDSFVEVKWSNIKDGPPPDGEINALGNFQKQPGATDYFDYDYDSIMHYGPRSFAKDPSQPTLVPKKSGVTIGQRDGMSFGDRQTIAKMYERFFTKGYSGVWRSGTGAYALWANAEWESFRTRWQEWSGRGLRLVDIHVRPTRSGLRYSGVFLPGTGGHALWVNASWDSFRTKWQELSGKGLRLHDLHVHNVGGQNRYSGVFLPGTGGHALWVNASWASFVSKWQELSGQGLRLVDLNTHRAGSQTRFSGAFLPGNDAHVLWANVTWQSFRAKWEELAGQGLRLVDFEFINPPAGQTLDGADADVADVMVTEEELEPFGGVFEASVPEQRREEPATVLEPDGAGMGAVLATDGDSTADGLGGSDLSGAGAPAGSQDASDGDGGVVLDVRTGQEVGGDEAGTGEVLLPEAVPVASGR